MSDQDHDSQLHDLLSGLLDESLTPQQHDELQRLLQTDPEPRRLYFEYVDLHLGLQLLHAEADHGRILKRLAEARSDQTRPQAGRKAWRTIGPWVLAASIVIFACGIGVLAWLGQRPTSQPTAPAPVAVLLHHAGAKFYGLPLGLATGSPLAAGQQYVLTEGQVHVSFRSGAEAIIEAPAVFLVADPMQLVISIGKCSVHAEGDAEGFVVATPTTQVIDRGTRFTVDVEETGEAVVQVTEGLTEVHPADGSSPPKEIKAGMARRYTGPNSREIGFDAARFTGGLRDRVVRYTTTRGPRGGAQDLIDVTVQRGGRSLTYRIEDLIGVKLPHFVGAKSKAHMTTGLAADESAAESRAAMLESDRNVNTGIINPGGSTRPLDHDPDGQTPGFAVRFDRPVNNGDGPDIVLFELQVVVHPTDGDAFHVSPLRFAPGLRAHTIHRFDLHLLSPEAELLEGYRLYFFDRIIDSLDTLESTTHNGGPEYAVPSRLLAVGIDLSDLGYAPGAAADGLFIQDALDDDNYLDPVLIVGLPSVDQSKK